MKILIPFALVLLSGCASVDRIGPYELAPARNQPSMKVQPVDLQALHQASGCVGSIINGVCYESASPDGTIAANAPSATRN
jgi:PBP1b-binding outer membrane lipoprotein LpoB